MNGEDGAERSHEATPQKLMQARRKGEVIRSQDIAVFASYAGALAALAALGPALAERMADLGGTLIQDAGPLSRPLRAGGAGAGGAILGEALAISGLLVAPAAGLVLAGLLAQRAVVFAPTRLAPKWQRISVLANARNKFGPSGLFEFAKSATKMVVFGGICGLFLVRNADRIVASAASDPRVLAGSLAALLAQFTVLVMLVSAAIAAADWLWQRHTHLAKNRMTRQELLDETKQAEGDPHLKGKRRRRAEEIATNRMLQDIPEAAVVVVNPTHYAVALRWSPADPSPPICVAKGVDAVAARIREAAEAAGVPIFSDPPTARALHASVEIGAAIEREHFAAVAAAIRFARSLDEGARG
ncbi:EscU/YscU/HrcU family type III secretion system export apparatus switch protein [Jannaschia ovalis]|uniref:EscU/YscU/HrcU family type III secretion system export apparatus switch protein n=1 Tax=Jannaschia ovalis TaxID=3038773 RepID=A0ABY8LJ09_9RHOB|nr:EscU/YscU/HrcU family type III secretion system export apparatus switch protein [Jannaschia sp. GRR-S6-38]WGH80174.1 EscU/YscU/HrcU family type III secretion system export apparatus switch protein [Jannaschia sp. GRR-S6-38]